MSDIRVLAFGAWDRGEGYPRGSALLQGLRSCGARVTECHVAAPFAGTDKQRLLQSPWLWPAYWWNMRRVRQRAIRALLLAIRAVDPDVVLVPYPGHLMVHWARSVWTGPIVLDLFLSAYDTAVVDRQMFRPGSLMAGLLRRLDRRAAAVADGVLLDTPQNADYVAELTGLPRQRFHVVPVSDPDELADPPVYRPPGVGEKLEVLFFGTGVPLHGLPFLLDALHGCEGVRLTLVGGTPEDRQCARSMPAHKVRVADEFLPATELRTRIARAHLVAGVFGTSEKASRVVPLKVMMALGAGRPVITGRTPAIDSVLADGIECVTAPVGDGRALANELQRLAGDPEELQRLAAAGRRAYLREFSLQCVGHRMVSICAAVSGKVVPRKSVTAMSSRAELSVTQPSVTQPSDTPEPIG